MYGLTRQLLCRGIKADIGSTIKYLTVVGLTATTARVTASQECALRRTVQARMYGVDSKSNKILKTLGLIQKQLERGNVSKLRNITSLPKSLSMSGKESFVGLEIVIEQTCLLALAASSKSEEFLRFVNPHQQIYPPKARYIGAEYDLELDQLISDGKPIKTVEEEEALCDFIDFLKRQNSPVLITWKGASKKPRHLELHRVLNNYPSLYSDIVSTVPGHIDLLEMVKTIGAYEGTSLRKLFESVIKTKWDINDPVSTAVVTRLLFSHFLPKGGVELFDRPSCFYQSTDFYHAKGTYDDLVLNKNLSLVARMLLARSGIGLDHLMFLKRQDCDRSTFDDYLLECGIRQHEIDHLYNII